MNDARELLHRIHELEDSLKREAHATLQPREVLALLSALTDIVVGLQNRIEGRDQSGELE